MHIHAPGSFSGEYEPRGDEREADCVLAHEFAVAKQGPGSVNRELARFVLSKYAGEYPLLLAHRIADALEGLDPYISVAHRFTGESATLTGQHTGSWGELEQAAAYMRAHDLHHPILVAQAFHVGRVALQAEKIGLDPIVPPGLPRRFDRRSVQPWTRNRALWAIREFPGAYVLKRRGQL